MKTSKHNEKAEFRVLKGFFFYFPFTLQGAVLFCVALLMLGFAVKEANSFGFFIAGTSVFTLVLLTILGRLQASGFQHLPFEWDAGTPLYAGQQGKIHCNVHRDITPLPFFRLHFFLKGKLNVGRGCRFSFVYEQAASKGNIIEIPIYSLFCGRFRGKGHVFIKDIFNLTRSRFGAAVEQELIVQPPIVKEAVPLEFKAVMGFEENSRQKDTNEEKYYQREYQPGDRVRDINWKATSRIKKLITKISLITQEKNYLITILLRNFSAVPFDSLESLVHLNYIKGWLLSFIRNLKKDNEDFQFKIITSEQEHLVDSAEDIQNLSLKISTLDYATAGPFTGNLETAGQVFVFSTPFDNTFSSLAATLGRIIVHLFRTRPSRADQSREDYKEIKLINTLPHSLFPGRWIFKQIKNHEKTLPLPPGNGILKERYIKAGIF